MTISRLSGTSTAEWNFETTKSATWPSGITANSIAILTVTNFLNSGACTVGTPTGFTKQVDDSFSGNALVVFSKECTGSESGTFNVVLSSAGYGSFVFDVYDGTGDLTYTSDAASDTGTGSDATAPSVSGTSGQLLLVSYGLSDPPGTTNSGPSGMTLATSSAFTTNSCRSYYQVLSSTGATGTKTWDFTNSRDWAGVPMLISEAGGGGGTTYTIIPSGGMTLSGGTSLVRNRVQTPSGGVTFAGTVSLLRTRILQLSGGVVFSGTSPITELNTYIITPSGGIVFAGTIQLIRERIVTPSGGVVFGGTARLFYFPAGGVGAKIISRISVGVSKIIGVS